MAKHFRFALQSLLDHRERLEEDAKNQWMLAQVEETKLREAHMEIGREILQNRNTSGSWHAISGEILRAQQDYKEHLMHRLEEARLALEAQREVVAQKQGELLLATRDRKAMEILRDKQKEEFRKAQAKAEQKFMDELGSQSVARRQIQNGD